MNSCDAAPGCRREFSAMPVASEKFHDGVGRGDEALEDESDHRADLRVVHRQHDSLGIAEQH